MPYSSTMKEKHHAKPKKALKWPIGAPEELDRSEDIRKDTVNEAAAAFVDSMMSSEWHPFGSHPHTDVNGFYVIMRWFAKEKSWVPLYVSGGKKVQIQRQFSGKEASAISKHLSSFPKEAKKLIWVKWVEDSGNNNESLKLNDVIQAVALLYNDGHTLAFNDEKTEPRRVPDNFSILQDWKPAKSKKKRRPATDAEA